MSEKRGGGCPRKKLSDQLQEWTKVICFVLLIIYAVGIVYMGVLCWRDPGQTYNLADVLKMPISVGIIGYLLKAGAENVGAIFCETKESPPEHLDGEM